MNYSGYFFIMEEIEAWKDVPEYDGLYQISSLGRVKSLGNNLKRKEKLLKLSPNGVGYLKVILSKYDVVRTFNVHVLVAIVFLGHIPCKYKFVVDHINGIKIDNRLFNLRIVSQRGNTTTCFRGRNKSLSSKYIGVSWKSEKSRWISNIQINGKNKYLGSFINELEAADAYQNELLKLNI